MLKLPKSAPESHISPAPYYEGVLNYELAIVF
jgi:hypothetical protein